MTSGSPKWPVLLQYANGSRIEALRDRDEWELDPDRHARRYRSEDRLIDSEGWEHLLVATAGGGDRTSIEPTGRRLEPAEVQLLVERHLARAGAQPEWLAAYLSDVPAHHKIRAAILYLAKLESQAVPDDSPEGED